jgi:hypothetical protein
VEDVLPQHSGSRHCVRCAVSVVVVVVIVIVIIVDVPQILGLMVTIYSSVYRKEVQI